MYLTVTFIVAKQGTNYVVACNFQDYLPKYDTLLTKRTAKLTPLQLERLYHSQFIGLVKFHYDEDQIPPSTDENRLFQVKYPDDKYIKDIVKLWDDLSVVEFQDNKTIL
jgi:hypothetical protein